MADHVATAKASLFGGRQKYSLYSCSVWRLGVLKSDSTLFPATDGREALCLPLSSVFCLALTWRGQPVHYELSNKPKMVNLRCP